MSSSINASTSGAGGLISTADNSGVLNLQTAGTTAVTIDTSQRVGIGTTTPNSPLQIVNSSVGQVFTLTSSSANVYGLATDGTISTYTGGVLTGSGGFVGTASAHPYIFRTNNTEVMRITSAGEVDIGGTQSFVTTGLYSNKATTVSEGMTIQETTGGGSTRFFMGFYNSGNAKVGGITTTGSSTTFATSSDYRLKENVQPMTGALATVAQLKPCTYDWIASKEKSQGFIAHELQSVVPECVVGEKDAVDAEGKPVYQGIDTSFLVATLTAALQELNAKVTALETQLGAK